MAVDQRSSALTDLPMIPRKYTQISTAQKNLPIIKHSTMNSSSTRFLLLFVLSAGIGGAQTYSLNRSAVVNGGGQSAGGTYSLTGSIGQPDAGPALSGGNYALQGGFWSVVQVQQTLNAPFLRIVPNGAGSIQILWPNNPGFVLQQTVNLTQTDGWSNANLPVTTLNGTNSVTIGTSAGSLFLRLKAATGN